MMPKNLAPQIYWLFGQSAAGRTELAQALSAHFKSAGGIVTLLDGDQLQAGLCEDLGFTEADLLEKVRRGAHVARIYAATGATVICSFLTPRQSHRRLVRQILGEDMRLIHIKCALQECQTCQAGSQERSAPVPESQIAGPDDFDSLEAADAVIATHDRPPAESLLLLSQVISTPLGETVRPAAKWQESAAAAGGGLSAR